MKKLILIVEDDPDIGNLIQSALTDAGFDTKRAYSGTEAMLLIESGRFDLILLDLMLPGMSGEEIVKKVGTSIPIIILSAKAGLDDKVNNLLGGAVDYITKPFQREELLARIQVQLRQNEGRRQSLSFGKVYINDELNTAFAGDTPLKLTKTEYSILRLLIKSPKRIFSRSQIIDLLTDNDREIWDSSLNVHIHNLRKKIYNACGEYYIEAIWGMGYRFYDEKS